MLEPEDVVKAIQIIAIVIIGGYMIVEILKAIKIV